MGRKYLEKQRKEKDSRVEQWVIKFLPKILDKSLKEITIDELVVLLGKSKSTFYEYFRSKDELFQYSTYIFLSYLEKIVYEDKNLQKLRNSPSDYLVSITKKLCVGLSYFEVNYVNEIKLYYPDAWNEIDGFIKRFLSHLYEVYSESVDTGEFNSYPIELMAALDNFFVSEIITNSEMVNGDYKTIDKIIMDFLNLRFYGLLGKIEN